MQVQADTETSEYVGLWLMSDASIWRTKCFQGCRLQMLDIRRNLVFLLLNTIPSTIRLLYHF